MFLVLFGFLALDKPGRASSSLTQIVTAVIDQLPSEAKAQFNNLFEVTKTTDAAAALEEVRKGDIDAAVEQRGNEVILHYSQADQVTAATVRAARSPPSSTGPTSSPGQPPTFTLDVTAVRMSRSNRSSSSRQACSAGRWPWARPSTPRCPCHLAASTAAAADPAGAHPHRSARAPAPAGLGRGCPDSDGLPAVGVTLFDLQPSGSCGWRSRSCCARRSPSWRSA